MSTRTERTPLTSAASKVGEVGVGIGEYVDHKVMTAAHGSLNLCDKIVAVLLYGHIVKRAEGWCSWCQLSCFDMVLVFIHSMPWRFFMHTLMVTSLVVLAYQVPSQDEMFITKHVGDTFVHNHFDSSHNTFLDIRRCACRAPPTSSTRRTHGCGACASSQRGPRQ